MKAETGGSCAASRRDTTRRARRLPPRNRRGPCRTDRGPRAYPEPAVVPMWSADPAQRCVARRNAPAADRRRAFRATTPRHWSTDRARLPAVPAPCGNRPERRHWWHPPRSAGPGGRCRPTTPCRPSRLPRQAVPEPAPGRSSPAAAGQKPAAPERRARASWLRRFRRERRARQKKATAGTGRKERMPATKGRARALHAPQAFVLLQSCRCGGSGGPALPAKTHRQPRRRNAVASAFCLLL